MNTVHSGRRAVGRYLLAALALLFLSPARLIAASEPGVAALLDRMTRAVLAGDVEGYLACVDRADPVFWKEQQNWGADFKRHVPKEFAVTFNPDEVKIEDGVAVVPLTMTWVMETDDSRERTLTFPARFLDHDGEWLFAGENWSTLAGPGVKVLFAKGLGDVAARVVEILPDVRAHVDEGFEIQVNRVQEVKLYNSMKHLQESIYLSYTDMLSGWNEPGESIKLLAGKTTGAGELKVLLSHEYGHVATFELGPRANDMPWWILEGVAELAAERYSNPGRSQSLVRSWAAKERLVPWERLSDFHTVKDADQSHVYIQGHHMVAFVSERFGRAGRNQWLRAMANGKSLDQATLQVAGMDFAGLDAEWKRSLSQTTTAPPPSGAD